MFSILSPNYRGNSGEKRNKNLKFLVFLSHVLHVIKLCPTLIFKFGPKPTNTGEREVLSILHVGGDHIDGMHLEVLNHKKPNFEPDLGFGS